MPLPILRTLSRIKDVTSNGKRKLNTINVTRLYVHMLQNTLTTQQINTLI